MALTPEDRKDVARSFGKKAASAVSSATRDSLSDFRIKKGDADDRAYSKVSKWNNAQPAMKAAHAKAAAARASFLRDSKEASPKSRALDSKAGKKKSGGSFLKYALGKSDREWESSDSYRAIHGKDGKVKKNIDQ